MTAPAGARARPRLDSLTGLRGVAAIAVFGYHVQPYLARSPLRHLHPILSGGAKSVTFFFVLSGFVLAWNHNANEPATRYYRKRVARIAPNHLVTWLAAVLILDWLGGPVPLAVGVSTLFLVQAWSSNPAVYLGANNVTWSLSCEVFLYLVLPGLLIPLASRRRRRQLFALAVVAAAVIDTLFVALPHANSVGSDERWALGIMPPVQLVAFALGAVAAREMRDRKLDLSWLFWPALAWSAIAFLGWGQDLPVVSILVDSRFAFTLLITASANRDLAGGWSPFHLRPLVWLGERSYAFYLVHYLVLLVITGFYTRIPRGGVHAGLFAIGWFGAAAVAGGLLFALVERPAERRLRGAAPRQEIAHETAPSVTDSSGREQ